MNQPILNPSPSSNRSILIPLSKEIHEISYFFKDKGTSSPLRISSSLKISNSLGTSNLLVSKNSKDKRIVNKKNIVSKLFISKNIEDKPISNYKLIVQISSIIKFS